MISVEQTRYDSGRYKAELLISSGQISGLARFVNKGCIRDEDARPVVNYEWQRHLLAI
jgi:hypothetical protein